MTGEAEGSTAADYESIANGNGIEAEAREGTYALGYGGGVESGLLVGAEKLAGDETVYRMASLTVDQAGPTADDFTLPDGTVLA